MRNPVTLWGFGAVGVEKDLTNTDIVMTRTFGVGTHPGLIRPMLDFLVNPSHKYLAEAAR